MKTVNFAASTNPFDLKRGVINTQPFHSKGVFIALTKGG
jgi:hypothetical protein